MERLAPHELRNWQEMRLRDVVADAMATSPYYQRVYSAAGVTSENFKSISDLSRLPVLTKTALREHRDELLSRNFSGPVGYKTTGGSTGQAVTILKDRVATAYARAAMWRNYGWWGIDIGDRQGRFWGVPLKSSVRVRYKLIDFLSNRIRLSSFDFNDTDLLKYYDRLRRFRPKYLYGYASMIYEFASFLRRKNLEYSVPFVVATSEVLYSNQRAVIEEVLKCRVVNEYGCGEVGPIACECPDGKLHLMADNLFVEIVKDDGALAAAGEIGQVVLTELHSRAMPLIRYQLLDKVEMGGDSCGCGRTLPWIRQVIGREYDYLVSESGKRFHGEKVMYLLEQMQDLKMGVRLVQVTQTSPLRVEIMVVRDESFKTEALDMMRAYFREALGQNAQIEFHFADQIPRASSGKFRVVVRDF